MTAPRVTLGERYEPIAPAAVWWQGRPLEVAARHFVPATAAASGASEAALLSPRREGDLAAWRRLGMAAAARCPHLTSIAVGEAFGRDHSAVIHALRQTEVEGVADREVGRRIAEIQWRAMQLAIEEMMEAGNAD